MVICGGNGCGKSAILEALMLAKECVGPYGNFNIDRSAISANAESAIITMTIAFTENERNFGAMLGKCHETEKISVEIHRKGPIQISAPEFVKQFLGKYDTNSNTTSEQLGFFEYINAYRQTQKTRTQQMDLQSLSDARIRDTLARSDNKFHLTKQYLLWCQYRDLQRFKTSSLSGQAAPKNSLDELKELFNSFFAPMKFEDIIISDSAFQFVVSTPNGKIDIDDLSSGEKEILNIFVRFHQLRPKGAIILFDEADAHLHPDLERKYIYALKKLSSGNQLLLTTHSPEMMIAAGTESLYSALKIPRIGEDNQLKRVTKTEQMHQALSELMGSRGIVSFNQCIVFIEGEDASADREIYERSYPPDKYNVSFVPAGNSSTVRKTAEQVNSLLTNSTGFQQYFSIVDKDIERLEDDPTKGKRLFHLPVYHIENLLLDVDEIFEVTKSLELSSCPYKNSSQVCEDLKRLVLSESHLNAYAKALMDAKVAKIAKEAYDAIYQRKAQPTDYDIPMFSYFLKEAESTLKSALNDDNWIAICKGRDLLKAYCKQHNIKYDILRNLLISQINKPPKELDAIMNKILEA